MVEESLPDHFHDDVLFAFGDGAGALWEKYCNLRNRLSLEVDAGRYPSVGPMDVGILHRLVKEFWIDDPMDYRMALNRITIDKDYYGTAMIGMGDLLAIRSVESYVVCRVEYKILEKLVDRPLIREIVRSMRQEGHSRGVARDIVLAESVISSCLSAVAALSSDHDSHVSSSEIGRLAMENGIGRLAVLQ